MAAIQAIERVLRNGDTATLPAVDAERIAKVAHRHRLRAAELLSAAADIRDLTRRPSLPLASVVWRIWGDQGATVLDQAAAILTETRNE